MDIQRNIKCPQCHLTLKSNESQIGKSAVCPKCQEKFRISRESFDGNFSQPDKAGGRKPRVTKGGQGKSPSKDDLSRGRQFGRFELKKILGSGAFGKVYLAYDPILDRQVALKIPIFAVDSKKRIKRFLVEAKSAAQLNHPNIVPVFDAGKEDGKYYIAYALIEGMTLAEKMKNETIDFHSSAEMVMKLAEGLHYAHSHKIIHRDVKPANIILDLKDEPYLTDFGLASYEKGEEKVTKAGDVLGTPAYMSPEQAKGFTDELTHASDQYSLGVVLYELLCGQLPFEGTPVMVMANVIKTDPPRPGSINNEIPRDLEVICQKAMEKEPEQRYEHCRELADDLRRWLDDLPIHARQVSLPERFVRWSKRNPVLAGLSGLVGILLLSVAIISSAASVKIREEQKLTEIKAKEAIEQREIAEAKTEEALENYNKALRNLVLSHFERGRNLCETGKINEGVLWLGKSLGMITPELSDLDSTIREYLGSWLPLLHSLEMVLPHEEDVTSLAFSPDGKILMTGTGDLDKAISRNAVINKYKFSEEGHVCFWDMNTGKQLSKTKAHEYSVTKVLFSPDGKISVSIGMDGQLRIFNPSTGKETHPAVNHPAGLVGAAFNHSGTLLVTSCLDHHIRLWNTKTWQLEGDPINYRPRFYSSRINKTMPYQSTIAFTADDQSLLIWFRSSDVGQEQMFMKIWDLKNRKEIQYPEYFRNKIVVGMSEDGRELAVKGEGDYIVLRDYYHPESKYYSISYEDTNFRHGDVGRESGLYVVGGKYRIAVIKDMNQSAQVGQKLRHNSELVDIAINDTEGVIGTADQERNVKIWKVSKKRSWGKIIPVDRGGNVKFTPDSKQFLSQDGINNRTRIRVDLRGVEKEALKSSLELKSERGRFSFNRDGKMFAFGSRDQTRIVSLDQKMSVGEVLKHPATIYSLKFIKDDQVLVTGDDVGVVRFWDLKSYIQNRSPVIQGEIIYSISVSPDQKYFLTCSSNGKAQLWDMETLEPIGNPITHSHGFKSSAFHPDGKYIATGSLDGSIYFWTVPGGKPARKPIVDYDTIGGVLMTEFLPDGKRLAIAGEYRGIQVWNLETSLPCSRKMYHSAYMGSVDLSPDGKKLVSWDFKWNGKDREVRLRELSPAIQSQPDDIRKMLEKMTGLKLEEDGHVKVLSAEEWNQLN